MSKIFFVGDMHSTFIQGDVELLKEDHEVFVLNSPTKLLQFPLYVFKCLQQVLNIRNSDLIWIWFADYTAVPTMIVSILLNKPTVVNVGGFEVSEIPEINYGNQLKLIRGLVSRWIIRNASAVIIPSPCYEEKIKNLIPQANVVMIPNFIETSVCSNNYQKEEIVVTALPVKTARLYKGVDILECAAKLSPYKILVMEYLPRPEYESTLERAKVYCQLSADETFGVALVEAMARGCIPVVSDKGALSWVVQDTGVVVPYGDITATDSAINKAMHMDGKPAQERARYFNREKKQEAVRKLIKELL